MTGFAWGWGHLEAFSLLFCAQTLTQVVCW